MTDVWSPGYRDAPDARELGCCTQIYLVNRDKAEVDAVIDECKARGYGDSLVHVATIEQAQQLEAPGAIVACVPDFPPKTDEEKLARAITEAILNKERKGSIEPTPPIRVP